MSQWILSQTENSLILLWIWTIILYSGSWPMRKKNLTLFILQRFLNKLYNLYLYLSLAWMIIARVHQNIYRWYYLYNHHPIEKECRKNVGQFLVNTSIQTAIPVFRVNFCLRVICKKQERYLRYMKTNYKNRPSVYYESIIAKYRNITC